MSEYKYIGTEIPRADGPDKAAGKAIYIHDLVLPGMLYGKIKYSDYAHAKIKNIVTGIEMVRNQFLDVLKNNGLEEVEALGKEFLAQALAMSPSSLYRRIKSITDLSINAFIRSIRLRRAAQLIQNTQYNISEICYQVGFNDQKYFRKCFREQCGRNPSEYAEQAV